MLKGVRPGMTLFEMGTNDRYWFTLVPEADTMWWGRYENLYKPQVREALKELMPIRPDLVLEVLGVGLVDTNFLQPPVPTMRFSPTAARLHVRLERAGGSAAGRSEVWYDHETFLPELVLLFDENGRRAAGVPLQARAGRHRRRHARGRAAIVATDYRLFFPDTGTSMWLALDDVTLDRDGRPTRRGSPSRPRGARAWPT